MRGVEYEGIGDAYNGTTNRQMLCVNSRQAVTCFYGPQKFPPKVPKPHPPQRHSTFHSDR